MTLKDQILVPENELETGLIRGLIRDRLRRTFSARGPGGVEVEYEIDLRGAAPDGGVFAADAAPVLAPEATADDLMGRPTVKVGVALEKTPPAEGFELAVFTPGHGWGSTPTLGALDFAGDRA